MFLVKLAGAIGGVGIISLAVVTGAKSFNSYPNREVFLIAESQKGEVKLFWEKQKGQTLEKSSEKFDLKVTNNGKEIKGKFLFCFPKSDKNEYYLLRWGNNWDSSSWLYNLLITEEQGLSMRCHESAISRMGEKFTKLNFKMLSEGRDNTPQEINLKNCINTQTNKGEASEKTTTLTMTCGGEGGSRTNNQKVEITAQLTKI